VTDITLKQTRNADYYRGESSARYDKGQVKPSTMQRITDFLTRKSETNDLDRVGVGTRVPNSQAQSVLLTCPTPGPKI